MLSAEMRVTIMMMMVLTMVMTMVTIMMMISPPLSLPACMCGVAYGSACTGTACGKSLKHIIIGLVPWIFIENRNLCLC